LNRIKALWADLEQALGQLSLREQMLVSVAAAVFATGLLGLGSYTVSRSIHRREVAIEEKSKALVDIGRLTATYRERELQRQQLEGRLRIPVRLFTYIDDTSKKQGIVIGDMQDRGTVVGNDKISESTVEFDLSRVTPDKLRNFMNEIEHGPHLVKIKKIRLRVRLDDPNSMDAALTVSTYSMG
jgi:hypothetical protein